MADYKTPGVYVEEISLLPPSVAQVATAVPAFIGYTKKAVKGGKSIQNVPTRITSLLDYLQLFGGACDPGTITVKLDGNNAVDSVDVATKFYMYDSLRMYFANGGGEAYIVSVGSYKDDVEMDALQGGIDACKREDHPTMLLCPDAMLLADPAEAYSLQQSMLMQCNDMQDRVSVMDVHGGYIDRADDDVVLNFRNGIGINFLKYGAAYYPWIQTTLKHEFGFENVVVKNEDDAEVALGSFVADPSPVKNVTAAIEDMKSISAAIADPFGEEKSMTEKYYGVEGEGEEMVKSQMEVIKLLVDKIFEIAGGDIKSETVNNELKNKIQKSSPLATIVKNLVSIDKAFSWGAIDASAYESLGLDQEAIPASTAYEAFEGNEKAAKVKNDVKKLFENVAEVMMGIRSDVTKIKENFDKMVYETNPVYQSIVNDVNKEMAKLPPSGAIAGIYAQTDSNRGVWKAPANVSLASTVRPWVRIDNNQQEDLNVDVVGGKSVNAIRAFTGKGTLVWGARTLAGNDNEWRYVSVRRFFIMVEQSVKLATNWAVFEPNDANTWIRVKAMIENFLTNLWQQGALAGASPDQAFFVNIGLGSTMNAVDILEGRMNVEIGMAAVRPAEFIILKFSHKLQES